MFTDENLGDCSPNARWLFAGLFTLADREGRLEDRPRKIKVEVMPYDNVDIEHLLRELTEARFITRYEVEGKRCIHIRTFHKHQHVHPKELPSQLPEPPDSSPGKTSLAREKLGQSVRKGRRDGKGREGKELLERAREASSKPVKSGTPASASLSQFFSEAYLDELQTDPAYGKIEVRHVAWKMIRWCTDHGKEITKERLLSWLNREYQPRKGNGSDGSAGNTKAKIARVVQDLVANHNLD
jgi:hypothetical protein